MEKWKARAAETLKAERAVYLAELDAWAEDSGRQPPGLDPRALLHNDLLCDAVNGTPTPYVMNIGCGFRVTSPGFRTKDGIAVTVVGIDPLAFGINDALKALELKHEILRTTRRYIYPLAAEEMSAAIPVGAFDAVWSENALLDCMDPFRVLAQAARVTKTGGVVCIKFKRSEDTIWKVKHFDGGKIYLESDLGAQEIKEVRGERVEIHTFPDESLMIKVRRPQRTIEEVMGKAKKLGLILPTSLES